MKYRSYYILNTSRKLCVLLIAWSSDMLGVGTLGVGCWHVGCWVLVRSKLRKKRFNNCNNHLRWIYYYYVVILWQLLTTFNKILITHCVKVSHYKFFSSPYFLYLDWIRRKFRPGKILHLDNFHAMRDNYSDSKLRKSGWMVGTVVLIFLQFI